MGGGCCVQRISSDACITADTHAAPAEQGFCIKKKKWVAASGYNAGPAEKLVVLAKSAPSSLSRCPGTAKWCITGAKFEGLIRNRTASKKRHADVNLAPTLLVHQTPSYVGRRVIGERSKIEGWVHQLGGPPYGLIRSGKIVDSYRFFRVGSQSAPGHHKYIRGNPVMSKKPYVSTR